MARESCISHPKNEDFFCVRRAYYELTGRDKLQAVALWLMEWLTTHRMRELRYRKRPNEEPWIENQSVEDLGGEVFGFLSVRRLPETITALADSGWIRVEKGKRLGQNSRYLFLVDIAQERVNQWSKEHQNGKYLDGQMADEEEDLDGQMADVSLAKSPTYDGQMADGIYKERAGVELVELKPENKPPVAPNAESTTNPFDPEDDLIGDGRRGFIANAYRRNRRPAPKLHTKANERLVASLRSAEDRYGVEEFRGALLRFLESDSDWLRKNGWPLYKFLKDLDQDGTPQQPGLLANCPTLDSAPPPTQAPSEKRRLILLWNSAIPEREFTDPDHHLKLHPEHAQMCEKLEAVFRKAADVVRGGSDCSWLNLRWLCGEKDGYPNWRKLLSGALDFKAQKKTAGRGYSTVTPESMREYYEKKKKVTQETEQSIERAKELGLDPSTNRF